MGQTLTNENFIDHEECSSCGSSDANALYEREDGSQHTYCFACETNVEESGATKVTHDFTTGIFSDIKDRHISKKTCKQFNVTIDKDHHYYPFYDAKGDQIASKVRKVSDKTFWFEGDFQSSVLFGQTIFPPGGKYVTVTEGELDALSVFELFDGKAPVVSLKNGASGAVKSLRDQSVYEYLNSFNNIVLCLDNDDPGRKAAKEIADIFAPGKCLLFGHTSAYKDASDYLQAGKYQEFTKAWWQSEAYTPENIVPIRALALGLRRCGYGRLLLV
jgi:twinkle protein